MFYMSIERDLAVAQIPKAGLTSIRYWLGHDFSVVKNDVARAASRRVAFIRHPLERLRSCYSFMCWHSEAGYVPRSAAPLNSWTTFVDHILSVKPDEHWLPQSVHVGDVPNIIRRFEQINECCRDFWDGTLPHRNQVIRLETNDYREADLMEFYKDDMALWSAA